MQDPFELYLKGWTLLACALPLGFALLLYWLTRFAPLAAKLKTFEGMSPASIGTVSLLFGLFSAFLAANIWQRVQKFEYGREREAATIRNLQLVAQAMGENGKPILLILRKYVKASLDRAPAGKYGEQFVLTGDILKRAVPAIMDAARTEPDQAVTQSIMLAGIMEIFHTRAERKYIASTHGDFHRWGAVILLGMLTQLTIAGVYVHSLKVQAAALMIFTLAFALSIAILAAHEQGLADPAFLFPRAELLLDRLRM